MARAEAVDHRVITLAELEREVARRTGPFFQAAQAPGSPTSSTATSAIMPALQTNALLGGPENLWLIRRQASDPLDRERMVQAFDPGAGRVIVDRNWQAPMAPGELADFTHLHPTQELRVAVQAGLRRCFMEETINLGPGSSYSGIDLTASVPWLTNPNQVLNVQYGWFAPYGDLPFKPFTAGGHVILGSNGMTLNGLWVTALRPHWSWVNGANSTTGPTDDDDQLAVDLDYAASAGHIEAWHLFPDRLFAAAAGNLQATQEMAAREFTRQSLIWNPADNGRMGFSEVVSLPLVG